MSQPVGASPFVPAHTVTPPVGYDRGGYMVPLMLETANDLTLPFNATKLLVEI
jgi:hypothetical protein